MEGTLYVIIKFNFLDSKLSFTRFIPHLQIQNGNLILSTAGILIRRLAISIQGTTIVFINPSSHILSNIQYHPVVNGECESKMNI